ncbi:MAG: rhomboid family intramembrane serine protease [Planctomycetes bacterium]|nr:rhomboid family intramembrane serine protease [Planctomycetota bacterium]
MGYDDRDYFQSKPRFEFSSGLHGGTKALMIALIAAFIGGLVLGDTTEFASDKFWLAVYLPVDKQQLAYRLFVLAPHNIIPVREAFEPGHWKLLTHWLVAPTLISAVVEVIFVYFVGRMIERLFGTRRFLVLFIGGAVFAGLMASLADPWIVGGRISVIMGATGGLIAGYMTTVWIAPRQKSVFGWPLRNVVLGVTGAICLVSVLMGVFGGGEFAALSPTQPIWGAVFGAGYMLVARKRGRVPAIAGGFQQDEQLEEWQKQGYLHDYKESEFDEKKFKAVADKQRDEELTNAKQRRGDQEKLDAILEKISQSGISSLTRKEKKFLDEQSKKGK